ncbi:FAD-dependent oxidoreductase [Lactobacillus acetotolerans]|uniref:FAD-dependent oxidoreductase n=1 Tax=Lactobacillus acetotolerans TaxID=1600 RepID=UPI001F0F01B0|nr:FAD-dependent oxidoreductase [Lactobacillus acetotolerans]
MRVDNNTKWNGNYDVIVLGFGGAGGTAARFAADNGAKVLLVDAAPYGHEGGNTRYSAQHVARPMTRRKLRNITMNLQHLMQYLRKRWILT